MFPLNTVLFPHQLLPLHVFEDRYRELTRRCLAADRRFGVVLIERGHEVGGGDTRFDTGTVAEILEAVELPDGRWLLETVGRRRFRVSTWLPDDPHPWAEVDLLSEPEPDPETGPLRERAVARLRRVLALANELGLRAEATVDLADDPTVASYQASALAGFGPLDALRLLEAPDAGARFRLLDDLLEGVEDLLRHRLGGG